MKENSGRFRLVHSSPLLESDIGSHLGMSGDGVLDYKILSNQANLEECPEVKEVLGLFKTGRRDKIDTTITT